MTENNIIVFTDDMFGLFGNVRSLMVDDEPWLVGKDVAEALGYKDTAQAIRKHVDDEDKGVVEMTTPGGLQNVTIINESGLYSLIFSSKLQDAKKFKRWVTAVVLPTLRKTGAYAIPGSQVDRLTQMQKQLHDMVVQQGQTITLLTNLVAEQDRRDAEWKKGVERRLEYIEGAHNVEPSTLTHEITLQDMLVGNRLDYRWRAAATRKLKRLTGHMYGISNGKYHGSDISYNDFEKKVLHTVYQTIQRLYDVDLNNFRYSSSGYRKGGMLGVVSSNQLLRKLFDNVIDMFLDEQGVDSAGIFPLVDGQSTLESLEAEVMA